MSDMERADTGECRAEKKWCLSDTLELSSSHTDLVNVGMFSITISKFIACNQRYCVRAMHLNTAVLYFTSHSKLTF